MAVSISASKEGLKIIDEARRKKGWTKYEEAWFQMATTSSATLKRFWAKKPIFQETFITICAQVGIEDWQAIVEATNSVSQRPPALSVYNPEMWVGRSTIINELLPKLQDKTRLVWITGIPGIGKTTLGECLASRVWDSNPMFQWAYLEVLEGQGADFTTVAADLLAKLGDRELDPQERNDPKRMTDRLIRKLQSSFYWVQLDSLERLLNPEQGTEFADAHWVTFLQRCLTERDFVSRWVLTSQALPSGLVEFPDRYPNVWAAKTLAGLLANESQNEHLEFFGKHGVVVDEENQAILSKLGQVYEGHTLVLQVMSGEIQADYAGDAARYWAVNQQEFEQVARSLDAKRLDETEYNDELDRRVRDRVKKSLQQLPTDAQDLLLRSSVYRRPVPRKFWLAMIDDRSASQQKEAYRVLSDRALVEREGTEIRQHNLVRSVTYGLLKANMLISESAERQAAMFWITTYEPALNSSNLEAVRGYLEAFDHYYVIGDWNVAQAIVSIPRRPPIQEPLYLQLETWRYYREQYKLCNKLLDIYRKTNNHIEEANALCNLGNACDSLGDYTLSVKHYQESLEISRRIMFKKGECHALLNLGNICSVLGNDEGALTYYQSSLSISYEIADKQKQSSILGNLGILSYKNKNFQLAINYYQNQLSIINNFYLDDKLGEATAIMNSAAALYAIGDNLAAIDLYEEALEIACEIHNKGIEGKILAGIAVILVTTKQYLQAEIYLEKSLQIAFSTQDRYLEAIALRSFAILYQEIGDHKLSISNCQKSLKIAIGLGVPLAEECRKLQEEIENCISVSSG